MYSQLPNIRVMTSNVAMPNDSEKVIAEIHATCIYRTLHEMGLDDIEFENALGKILNELKRS